MLPRQRFDAVKKGSMLWKIDELQIGRSLHPDVANRVAPGLIVGEALKEAAIRSINKCLGRQARSMHGEAGFWQCFGLPKMLLLKIEPQRSWPGGWFVPRSSCL